MSPKKRNIQTESRSPTGNLFLYIYILYKYKYTCILMSCSTIRWATAKRTVAMTHISLGDELSPQVRVFAEQNLLQVCVQNNIFRVCTQKKVFGMLMIQTSASPTYSVYISRCIHEKETDCGSQHLVSILMKTSRLSNLTRHVQSHVTVALRVVVSPKSPRYRHNALRGSARNRSAVRWTHIH